MTAVLKASDWLNGQLSCAMQLDSREALCMEHHVCTTMYFSVKSHKKNIEKTYRDGILKKQPNKAGKHDTTVPLRTPIPISFDISPTRSYAFYME